MACLVLESRCPEFSVAKSEEFYIQLKTWQVMDAKSVYDHRLSNNSQSGVHDRRTAPDFIVAAESQKRL